MRGEILGVDGTDEARADETEIDHCSANPAASAARRRFVNPIRA